MARCAAAPRDAGERLKHWLGTAAEQMLRRFVLLQQLRDETAKAEAAVVGGEVHSRAGLAKIVDAGRQLRRAHAVVECHALHAPPRRCAAIAALAEQLAQVG